MTDAVAEAIQVPREMAFMFGLSVISAAIGGRREVEVRQDWTELVVIYTVTVAAPSERKSPVVKRMLRALRAVAAKRKRDARARRTDLEKQIADAERTATAEHDEAAAKDAWQQVDKLKADLASLPTAAKMFADNITPQKLAADMAGQDGRMAILIAEGGDLFGMVCASKGQAANAAQGASLSIYLKAYTGEPHMEGRITRDDTDIDRPALTLGVMVQPAVMTALAGEDMLRGTGLLDRMLYAQPTSRVGYRKAEPDSIPKPIGETFDKAITALAEKVFDDHVITLTLTPASYKLVIGFNAMIEKRLRPDADLDPIAQWAGKLTGQIVRIAALLTLFDDPTATQIDELAVQEAITLEPFLVGQAKRAADLTSGRSVLREHPQAVVDVIRRRKFKEFTPRVIQRSLNKPWVKAETIAEAIAELEDRGYVRHKHPHLRYGPDARTYEVNPAVHADQNQ